MRLTSLMLVALVTSTCAADLMDDFEDGDYTHNPTWTVVNVAGEAAVAADPIRPDNLVLSGYGSEMDQHRLRTALSHPRASFDLTFELFVPSNAGDITVALEGDVPESDAMSWRIIGGPFVTTFVFSDGTTTWTTSGHVTFTDCWWWLHLWNDPVEEIVLCEVDTGHGSIGGAYGPVSGLESAPPFSSVSIGFARPAVEYVDNVHLTTVPEPSAMLLVAMVLLRVPRRRRSRRSTACARRPRRRWAFA